MVLSSRLNNRKSPARWWPRFVLLLALLKSDVRADVVSVCD